MLHNAALPSLSLQSQLARRSQGALKDALAQRKLIRFIKKQAKKRSNSKAISVDFVLVVMEKGGLTRQESIALINHIVGHTSKKSRWGLKTPSEDAVQFILFMNMSTLLFIALATPYPYGLLLLAIWFLIFVCIQALRHCQTHQTEGEF